MKETGQTEERLKKGNVLKIFGIIFSIMIAIIMQVLTIHQFGPLGMIGGDPTKALPSYDAFIADYGTAYRTFKHGVLTDLCQVYF